jgi:hypothetical protein
MFKVVLRGVMITATLLPVALEVVEEQCVVRVWIAVHPDLATRVGTESCTQPRVVCAALRPILPFQQYLL